MLLFSIFKSLLRGSYIFRFLTGFGFLFMLTKMHLLAVLSKMLIFNISSSVT